MIRSKRRLQETAALVDAREPVAADAAATRLVLSASYLSQGENRNRRRAKRATVRNLDEIFTFRAQFRFDSIVGHCYSQTSLPVPGIYSGRSGRWLFKPVQAGSIPNKNASSPYYFQ
jgi:hypothetical protein